MLSIAICDDEKNICDYLEKRTRECLAKYDMEARIGIFGDGTDLLEYCRHNPVTSSAEYVFSGYEAKAFRYILKTELENAFDHIFGECLGELKKQTTDFYTIQTPSLAKKIPLDEILYFESKLRLIKVHTKNEEISFYGKLDEIEKELDQKDFLRIHQSFLVNATKIKSLTKEETVLNSGAILPVSKSRANAVREAYLWSKR